MQEKTGHAKQLTTSDRSVHEAVHYGGLKPWTLPFESRQINGSHPGHLGPSCEACTEYQERCWVIVQGHPFGAHAASYAFEARYSEWMCTQGLHGSVHRQQYCHHDKPADFFPFCHEDNCFNSYKRQ